MENKVTVFECEGKKKRKYQKTGFKENGIEQMKSKRQLFSRSLRMS